MLGRDQHGRERDATRDSSAAGRQPGDAGIDPPPCASAPRTLGLSDVWVSEHIIVPRKQFPRSPLFYDPVLTLTWVAAVTERVRLGTSVIVLPMRHPLPLAKELSTLHNLSGGRLILGVGVGWLEAEFAALGRAVPRARPAHGRGHRDDARGVVAGPGQFRGQIHPRRDPRHDDAAAAGEPHPDVARQPLGGGAPPHRAGSATAGTAAR